MSNGTSSDPAGQIAGTEGRLSDWAAPYVTDILGKGKALADQPYTAYTGHLQQGNQDYKHRLFRVFLGLPSLPRKWELTALCHLLRAPQLNSI